MFITRFFVILFSLIFALLAASIALAIGIMAPELVTMSSDPIEKFAFFAIAFFSTSFVGATAFVPAVILIAIAETFNMRSIFYYAIGGCVDRRRCLVHVGHLATAREHHRPVADHLRPAIGRGLRHHRRLRLLAAGGTQGRTLEGSLCRDVIALETLLAIKLVYTAFMAVLIPVYLYRYGPTNFLYFCDLALLFTLAGLWLESPLLISMCAVGMLVPQALWVGDFVFNLFGRKTTGLTDYMFDKDRSLFLRGLSLFHGWLPFLLALSRLADGL